MTDPDRPDWARRIRQERTARGWSQPQAVRQLQHAGAAGNHESLLRTWRRWEAGQVEPDSYNKPLLAKTFGTVTHALFRPPVDRDGDLLAATGLDTAEIVDRLRVTDVSQATVDALQITAERPACDYSRMPPADLHIEATAWLRRLTALLDRRLTLAQHREILATAGQLALLVGSLEADMALPQAAEGSRHAALTLGGEAGDAETVGWAFEMGAWFALTRGDYREAIASADAGLAAVGPEHGVAVQLEAHRAKAWARIGDRREVETALEHGRAMLEAQPFPTNPGNHFVVDPSKWDFYTLDVYRHLGDDRLAEAYAREVLRQSVDGDGVEVKPMRAAEARITLGVVAARDGDLEGALMYGRQALAGSRRSLPSLRMVTRELGAELVRRFPDEPEAHLYLDELRALAA